MERALNPFVICKAAAGSGKTFTLVKEYLKLAMALPSSAVAADRRQRNRELRRRFRGILAITFTNKAANQMKTKVMEYLDQIVDYGVDKRRSPMGEPLLSALNAAAPSDMAPRSEQELQEDAAVLRSAILHGYSDFSVCTIDSFMHRVVRTFAHDLNKPVNFDVSLDQGELIDRAVDELMALVGTPGNEALTRLVQAFADSRMEEGANFKVEREIADLGKLLFREDSQPYLALLSGLEPSTFMELHDRYTAENRSLRHQLRDAGAAMMKLLADHGIGQDDCASGKTGYYSYFRGLACGEVQQPGANTVKAFTNGKLASSKCGAASAAELQALAPRMTDIYKQVVSLVGTDPTGMRDYNTREAVAKNIYSMALLGKLHEQVEAYSKENEVLHLSEFNRLINEVVREEPAPFIYERLGSRYHHYLIDEFQDTSVLQWHNLVPLVDNGVSEMHQSLIVGDGKQAIYRWRQGDVGQFVDLPTVHGIEPHGTHLSDAGAFSLVPLNRNFRTASSVVMFNNRFFEWLLEQEPYASNELAQRIYIGERDENGHPALWQYLPEDKEVPVGHVGLSFVADKEKETICAEVLAIIRRMVEERGYRQRDILILGRSNAELAYLSSYILANSNYTPSSTESFFLSESQAVMAVVAAMRVVVDPADRVAASELLHRLAALGLCTSTHDAAFAGGTVDVAALLHAEPAAFVFKPDYVAGMGLYDACEELVRELRLDGMDMAYLSSLLNYVAAYAAHNHDGIEGFLDWLDDHMVVGDSKHQLSAACSDAGDTIQLMTIHKAKGLEAPVVICPFFPQRPHGYELWVKPAEGDQQSLPAAYVSLAAHNSTLFDDMLNEEMRQEEVDRLNVLYVALTRPQEQLYLVCPPGGDGSYSSLIDAFVKEKHPDLGDAEFHSLSGGSGEPELPNIVRLSYEDWTTRVKTASPAEKTLTSPAEQKRLFGTYAHDLLSAVKSAADVDEASRRFFERQPLEEDVRRKLQEVVHRVVSDENTAPFFAEGNKVLNECEMTDGKNVYRPDRVVITSDGVWVVDYKTGREMHDRHEAQVRQYGRLIEEMGYANVRGCIIYLENEVSVHQVTMK